MPTMNNNPLVFWKDLSPHPTPVVPPTPQSPRVLIVGGGVTGLTTAWTLLDKGYHVTVVSKEWASYGRGPRLASQIAGALWEYPPAVCGQHSDAISLQHSKRWCMVAYHIWDAIASSPTLSREAGVQMRRADFFFPHRVEGNAADLTKMREIMASGVRGFRHDPLLIAERGADPTYGAVDAYEHLAPVIDTDRAMTWLMHIVESKGASMVTRTLHGDLLANEAALCAEYGADVIVNATGIAGTELAADPTCYPIRGGLIRVLNDGRDFPKVETALTITADMEHPGEIIFIVPRNDDVLILGGIVEPHKGELDLTLDSPIIQRMRARCESFLPGLRRARLDPEYPLAQGLRPFRKANVRVERELRPRVESVEHLSPVARPSRIVHSYGQGGAGWSLSFGCAVDVVGLVEEALLDKPPRPLATESSGVLGERRVVAHL